MEAMYDTVIVGAGPAGLTAAIFARARRMRTLLVDANKAGGQLVSIYPTKTIYDYPSFEAINAAELAKRLVDQALNDGSELREGETVTDLRTVEGAIEVVTDRGAYQTKTVILSIGMGIFEPKRLGIEGEEEFRGRGVHFKMPGDDAIAGKRVLVVGGGDSALESAMTAARAAAEVTLVHRRAEFRAMESNVEALKKTKVDLRTNSECRAIRGDDRVRSAVLLNNLTNEKVELPVDVIIINIGARPNLEAARKWDLELDGRSIKVSSDMRTTRRGVFACGDIVAFPGKTNRIVIACGYAAIAANSAYRYISKPYWD